MTLQQKYLKRITYINAKIFFLTMQHTKKKKGRGGGAEVVFYFMLSQLSKIDKTFDTKD